MSEETKNPGPPESGSSDKESEDKPGGQPPPGPGDTAAPPPAKRAPAGPAAAGAGPRAEAPSVPLSRLRERFPEIAGGASFFAGVPLVDVPVGSLVEVCRFLKEDPEADCKYLSNLHGTHNPDRPKPLEVVYNLFSVNRGHWIQLRVEIPDGEEVPSVVSVWQTADWHEREAYDLVGIRFSGHPALRRILLPEDWAGHPLRKDYPLEGKEGDHKLYR